MVSRLRPPRFTLGTLLLVILVCSLAAACMRYFVQGAQQDQTSGRAFFVMSVLLIPMLLMISANLVRLSILGLRWYQDRRESLRKK